jgi:hypothetical protein
LQGHAIMVGYDGHLWSHGYDYKDKKEALERFFLTGEESPLLQKMTHVFVGPRERAHFGEGVLAEPPKGWRLLNQTENQRLFERIPAGSIIDESLLRQESDSTRSAAAG